MPGGAGARDCDEQEGCPPRLGKPTSSARGSSCTCTSPRGVHIIPMSSSLKSPWPKVCIVAAAPSCDSAFNVGIRMLTVTTWTLA